MSLFMTSQCNNISLFGDWYCAIELFVKFAVSFLIRSSDLISFCEIVFLLYVIWSRLFDSFLNCYVTLKNLKFSKTRLNST